MSNLIVTKKLHNLINQTLIKYEFDKAKFKTRIPSGWDIPKEVRHYDKSNVRVVEYLIIRKDNKPIDKIVKEITTLLLLNGYNLHIYFSSGYWYRRNEIKLKLYALIKKD